MSALGYLEKEYEVRPEHAASNVSSGAVYVLSTPAMISFMEDVSFQLSLEFVKQGETTVGIRVDVKHLKAVAIGEKVKVRSELVEFNNRRMKFRVYAYWKDVLIGEGIHERAVVDYNKFMANVLKSQI
jgi:predicted thioesterase